MNELLVLSNPRRRRRAKKHRVRRNPRRARRHAHKRRRRSSLPAFLKMRRNPSRRRSGRRFGQGGKAITGLLIPGFLGAAGALGFDVAYSKVSGYLPASLQGNYYVLAGLKLLAAVGIAKFGGKLVKPQTAIAIAAGVATVTLYDVGQIVMGSVISPPATTAAPAPAGTSGLGYAGSGMQVNMSDMPRNRFTGFGERIGLGGFGERIGLGDTSGTSYDPGANQY